MKLLIVTQVIDLNHPILGFFHRWVQEFATQCESVQVIALEVGTYDLPENVTVHSLGKETGHSRLGYLWRFGQLVWQLRHQYDAVFVHMNQEYVLLAGWWWRWLGKPVALWRNHYAGSWLTRVACAVASKVYYTSSASYTARCQKAVAMPIGIDVSRFTHAQSGSRGPSSLLYVGRISDSKRIHVILEALARVQTERPDLTLTIIGGPGTAADEVYLASLEALVAQHHLPVTFLGPVPWEQLPTHYQQHELLINLSPPGMFDKVIGEALACHCDVVTSNLDLQAELADRVLVDGSLDQLVSFLRSYQYDAATVDRISRTILERHGLSSLVRRVLTHFEGKT